MLSLTTDRACFRLTCTTISWLLPREASLRLIKSRVRRKRDAPRLPVHLVFPTHRDSVHNLEHYMKETTMTTRLAQQVLDPALPRRRRRRQSRLPSPVEACSRCSSSKCRCSNICSSSSRCSSRTEIFSSSNSSSAKRSSKNCSKSSIRIFLILSTTLSVRLV